MSDQKRGILTIISGFSGAGKGTVVGRLLEKYPERYKLSISATTRSPRNGEEHGVHYFFKSDEEFQQMIENDAFLEYAQYVEHSYGTPRQYVEENLAAGYDVILEIEQQGAFAVKKAVPEAILIFLTPPTIEELERRLRNRKTESDDVTQSWTLCGMIPTLSSSYVDLYFSLCPRNISQCERSGELRREDP